MNRNVSSNRNYYRDLETWPEPSKPGRISNDRQAKDIAILLRMIASLLNHAVLTIMMSPVLFGSCQSTCDRVGFRSDEYCLGVLVEVKLSLESFASNDHPEQTF